MTTTLTLDIEQEIKRLKASQIVELDQVRSLHTWLDLQRISRQPGRIVGESRTGKSCGVKSYLMEHPPQQVSGSVLRFPVVLVEVPQDCGAKQLYTLIIESLQFKITKGTIEDLRRRVYRLLKDCQVEMLIIDEADRIKPKTFADVRDIYDKLNIAVILVGTERLTTVINRDEQVKNRFLAYFQMGVIHSEQFGQTVAIWERDILRLPVPSNLTNKSALKLLREKTRGYIGILDMILRQAAIVALSKGKFKIDLETLKEVMAGYG